MPQSEETRRRYPREIMAQWHALGIETGAVVSFRNPNKRNGARTWAFVGNISESSTNVGLGSWKDSSPPRSMLAYQLMQRDVKLEISAKDSGVVVKKRVAF